VFLATLAVWMLVVCAGAGTAAGALQQLGENGAFVSSLLAAELGGARGGGLWEGLDGWGRLVVDQSPLLQANHGGARPEGDGEKPGPALDLPAGQVRSASTEEKTMLHLMAEDYDVDVAYVVDMYNYEKISWIGNLILRIVLLFVLFLVEQSIEGRIKRMLKKRKEVYE